MLQQIRPDFGGSAQSMDAAGRNIHAVGEIAGSFLDRMRQARLDEQAKKTRQEDVDYRQQQAQTAKDQFGQTFGLQEKQFGLAQSAEDRAKGADIRIQKAEDRKILGQNMASNLDTAMADVMDRGALTQPGQKKLLATAKQMEAQGKSPEEIAQTIGNMYETNQGAIRQVPMGYKQKIAAVEGIGLGTPDYDPTIALGRKDTLLSSLRSDYQKELDRAQQKALHQANIAAEDRRNRQRIAATKDATFKPVLISKGTPGTGGYVETYANTPEEYARLTGKYDPQRPGETGFTRGKLNIDEKKDGFKLNSVVNSPLLRGLDIGSWDNERLLRAASNLQTKYKLSKDEAEAVAMAGVDTGGVLPGTSVDLNRMRDAYIDARYPNFGSKPVAEQKRIINEVANTLNYQQDKSLLR